MDPQRRQRIDHFKRKFLNLRKVDLLREYVRYERARDGTLPHPFPQAYVDEAVIALDELLIERFGERSRAVRRMLDILRRQEPRPFI